MGENGIYSQVLGENVKCESGEGTCTKSGTIILKNNVAETKYQLKQGGVVLVGGSEVKLPYTHGKVSTNNF